MPLPACAEEGLTLESVGAGGGGGAVIVKVIAPLVPLAFWTVIEAVPAEVIRLAGIVATRDVELPKVVASAVPLKRAVVGLINPVPVNVIEVAPEPACTDEGLMLVSVGAGGGGTVVIVKVRALEVPPASWTVTETLPAVRSKLEGIVALRLDAPRNVVDRFVPSKFNVVGFENPVPVMLTGRFADPACAELGEMLVSVGAGGGGGLVTVNVMAFDVPLAF